MVAIYQVWYTYLHNLYAVVLQDKGYIYKPPPIPGYQVLYTYLHNTLSYKTKAYQTSTTTTCLPGVVCKFAQCIVLLDKDIPKIYHWHLDARCCIHFVQRIVLLDKDTPKIYHWYLDARCCIHFVQHIVLLDNDIPKIHHCHLAARCCTTHCPATFCTTHCPARQWHT